MSVDELLAVVADRGLSLVVAEDGTPRLRGDRSQATPALLKLLALRREDIVERLKAGPAPEAKPTGPRLREWLTRRGYLVREREDWASVGDAAATPSGVWWWRWAGESGWRLIEGREPAEMPAEVKG